MMRRSMFCGAMLLVVAVVQGCYTYVPLDTDPPAGERVALVITDRGRVGLAERLGTGVGRVEGRLVQNDPNDFVLNVFRIGHLGGESSRWSGESVRLSRDFVGRVERRQLSRSKTFLAAGGVAAGITLFIVTRGLIGSGSPDDEPTPPPPPTSGRVRGW